MQNGWELKIRLFLRQNFLMHAPPLRYSLHHPHQNRRRSECFPDTLMIQQDTRRLYQYLINPEKAVIFLIDVRALQSIECPASDKYAVKQDAMDDQNGYCRFDVLLFFFSLDILFFFYQLIRFVTF